MRPFWETASNAPGMAAHQARALCLIDFVTPLAVAFQPSARSCWCLATFIYSDDPNEPR